MTDDDKEPADDDKAVAERPRTDDGDVATGPDNPAPTKPGGLARLQELFKQYGPVALVTWFSIFGLTWAGFAAAISLGFEVDGAVGGAGTAGAAYIATQLVKPIRIIATLALTPVIATAWQRLRPRREALKAIAQSDEAARDDEED